MRIFNVLFSILFLFCNIAHASEKNSTHFSLKCILPAVDTYDDSVKYSRANIKGMIVKKISSELIIKETKTNKMALINFNKKTGLYTLYGGNVPLDVLRPDIKAWVWFENCETPTKKTPLAIMILISSTDPNDQVSEWKTMPDYLK